ncbi:hypothetical protein [Parasphingorhabdus sp.]|uniref:hypothetical protein n=1 Tax=Parasphingorhabdus sp. TaxID=2709688 RepID=UPI0032994270
MYTHPWQKMTSPRFTAGGTALQNPSKVVSSEVGKSKRDDVDQKPSKLSSIEFFCVMNTPVPHDVVICWREAMDGSYYPFAQAIKKNVVDHNRIEPVAGHNKSVAVPTAVKDNLPRFDITWDIYLRLDFVCLSNDKLGLRLFPVVFKHCSRILNMTDANSMGEVKATNFTCAGGCAYVGVFAIEMNANSARATVSL